MKHKEMILAAHLLTMATLSCSEDFVREAQNEELEFRASFVEEGETKTAVQSDGTSVWWSPDESINVFYGTRTSGKFTSTNTEAQSTASFRGVWTSFSGTIEEENAAPVQLYWAVYPYDDMNTCDGESVTMTVPSFQQGKEGSFADGMFPAIACSSNLDLAFYYVCGGVRFSVAHPGITTATLKSNADEPLAGTVRVGFGKNKNPEIQVLDGVSFVEISAPDGGFVPGKYYFAALLPQTLSQGLALTFHRGTLSASYVITTAVTVNRSRFGKLDNKDKDLEINLPEDTIVFADDKVREICLKWDTNGDGNLSFAEAAAVRDLEYSFSSKLISSFNELKYFHGVTSIGKDAFRSCYSLTSLEIPSGVTSIGEGAFANCSSLTSLEIPSGVTSIGEDAFANCSSLTSLKIPSGVTSIGGGVFYGCSSLTSLEIPSGVTNIGLAAFYGCENLTSMTIPSGVTNIGNYAFYRCYSLLEVRSLNPVPPSLSQDSYSDLRTFTDTCEILVPKESIQLYQSQWSQYSGQIKALEI